MTQQDIADALDARLALFTPVRLIAWEGPPFRPALPHPFLSPRLSSYTRTVVGAGTDGMVQHDGTYTVVVRHPAEHGRRPAGQLAAALRAHFHRSVVLAAADGKVLLLNAAEQAAMDEGNWIGVPVVVTFTAQDPHP